MQHWSIRQREKNKATIVSNHEMPSPLAVMTGSSLCRVSFFSFHTSMGFRAHRSTGTLVTLPSFRHHRQITSQVFTTGSRIRRLVPPASDRTDDLRVEGLHLPKQPHQVVQSEEVARIGASVARGVPLVTLVRCVCKVDHAHVHARR